MLTLEQKQDRIRQSVYIEYCKNRDKWKCFWVKDIYCIVTEHYHYELDLKNKAESVYDKIISYLKLDFIDYEKGFSDNDRVFMYIVEKCAL